MADSVRPQLMTKTTMQKKRTYHAFEHMYLYKYDYHIYLVQYFAIECSLNAEILAYYLFFLPAWSTRELAFNMRDPHTLKASEPRVVVHRSAGHFKVKSDLLTRENYVCSSY